MEYGEYELYHHGILGMHWGIRRYQNEDGTLTEAGKQRYRTDSKFAAKYDKESAKRQKISNINKRQKGSYSYASQDRADVNNRHHNILSTAAMTTAEEIGPNLYKTLAGKKRTKGIANTGRIAAKAGINYWYKKKYEEIAQDYALRKYNDDGTKKIKEGSAEAKRLERQKKWKQTGYWAASQALKVISDITITKIANTDFKEMHENLGRGARQSYDINGKWAKWQGPRLG